MDRYSKRNSRSNEIGDIIEEIKELDNERRVVSTSDTMWTIDTSSFLTLICCQKIYLRMINAFVCKTFIIVGMSFYFV